MREMRFFKGLKIVLFVVLASAVLGFVVEHLWNWLMPQIVGAHAVTYWQALGLFVLGKLLFGGFHRGGGGRRRAWKREMGERFAGMSEEERVKFRAGMRGRACDWSRRSAGVEEKGAV